MQQKIVIRDFNLSVKGKVENGELTMEVTVKDFTVEQTVFWEYTDPHGWNFTGKVKGTVKKITAKRVQIEVENRKGEKLMRWVKPEKLTAR